MYSGHLPPAFVLQSIPPVPSVASDRPPTPAKQSIDAPSLPPIASTSVPAEQIFQESTDRAAWLNDPMKIADQPPCLAIPPPLAELSPPHQHPLMDSPTPDLESSSSPTIRRSTRRRTHRQFYDPDTGKYIAQNV